jgi:hypothetical protein
VTLEDYSSRAVAVDKVNREEQGLGTQFVEGVSFDEEIQQELAHVPANLRLKINRSNIGQSNDLRTTVSIYT